MPQAAEDLAEDIIFEYLDAGDWLRELQKSMLVDQRLFVGRSSAATAALQKKVRQKLVRLEKDIRDYYRTTLPRIYLAGAKSALEKGDTFRITEEGAAAIKSRADRAVADHLAAAAFTEKDSRRWMTNIRKGDFATDGTGKRTIPLPSGRLGTLKGEHDRFIRLHGIESIRYKDGKKYNIDDFMSMSLRTNANAMFNTGASHAARQNGRMLEVSDGPDCGWEFHADTDQANGKVVLPEEALAHPLAHPNCRRTFKPGRKMNTKEKRRDALRAAAKAVAERQRTAEKVAVSVASATAASALMVAAFRNQQLRTFFSEQGIRLLRGSPLQQFFLAKINEFKGLFATGPRAEIIPFPGQAPTPPGERQVINGILGWADRVAHGLDDIPDRVEKMIGDPLRRGRKQLESRVATFAQFERFRRNNEILQEGGNTLAHVIELEARRRNANKFYILKDRLKSGIQGSWSGWGPRLRTDMTEWFRGRATFTPTGVIKSLTVGPAKAVRAQIKMFQKGQIGGHLSLIPKGPFRALVEIDQYGKLVGNFRLIPRGPVKVRLEFRLKGWNARAFGSGEGAIDFRQKLADSVQSAWQQKEDLSDRLLHMRQLGVKINEPKYRHVLEEFNRTTQLYEERFAQLRDLTGFQFQISRPRVREFVHDLRQLEFRRVVVEYRFGRMGPLELSGELKMPIEELKAWLKHPINLDKIKQHADGTLSGTIQYVKNDLLADLRRVAQKSNIVANIRFKQWVLPTNIRTRINFENLNLQRIATNLQIHGYNVVDVANVLELKARDVAELQRRQWLRLGNWLRYAQIRKVEDLNIVWAARLEQAKSFMRLPGGREPNELDLMEAAILRMDGKRLSQGPSKVLKALAGIVDEDLPEMMERKLLGLREFLKVKAVDRPDWGDILDGIQRGTLRRLAGEFSGTVLRFGPRPRTSASMMPAEQFFKNINQSVLDFKNAFVAAWKGQANMALHRAAGVPINVSRYREVLEKFVESGVPHRDRVLSWGLWLHKNLIERLDQIPMQAYLAQGKFEVQLRILRQLPRQMLDTIREVVPNLDLKTPTHFFFSRVLTEVLFDAIHKGRLTTIIPQKIAQFGAYIDPRTYPQLNDEVNAWLHEVRTLYPFARPFDVTVGALLNPSRMMEYHYGRKVLKISPTKFLRMRYERTAAKIARLTEKGWFAADGSINAQLWHEFGHYIEDHSDPAEMVQVAKNLLEDYGIPRKDIDEVISEVNDLVLKESGVGLSPLEELHAIHMNFTAAIKDHVSTYATKNWQEWFAEEMSRLHAGRIDDEFLFASERMLPLVEKFQEAGAIHALPRATIPPIHPDYKVAIDDHIDRLIEATRRSGNPITRDQYKDLMSDIARELYDDSDEMTHHARSDSVFEFIPRDGLVKNQFDLLDPGQYNPDHHNSRNIVEERLYQYSKDSQYGRPVYGAVAKYSQEHQVEMYGNIEIILKDEIKDRTTVTFGDSFFLEAGGGGRSAVPFHHPDWRLVTGYDKTIRGPGDIDYLEVQISRPSASRTPFWVVATPPKKISSDTQGMWGTSPKQRWTEFLGGSILTASRLLTRWRRHSGRFTAARLTMILPECSRHPWAGLPETRSTTGTTSSTPRLSSD
jgi:hypothetical protein